MKTRISTIRTIIKEFQSTGSVKSAWKRTKKSPIITAGKLKKLFGSSDKSLQNYNPNSPT